MSREYDRPTDEHFNNPKLIWEDQIAGRKHFDWGHFIGALVALSHVPDWQSAFAGLPNAALFLERVEAFFRLHRGSLDAGQGTTYLYFAPLERDVGSKELLDSAKRFLKLCSKVSELSSQDGLAKEFNEMNVVLAPANGGRDSQAMYESLGEIGLYDVWGDLLADYHIKGWSHVHYCIKEGCYGLAADPYLSAWMMQGFYDLDLDFESYVEFVWFNGGSFWIEDGTCFVFHAKGRQVAD